MTYAPTHIDLSSIPAPAAIEALNFETLFQGFVSRFKMVWDAARLRDPTLPEYDVEGLEYDPAVIIGQAWTFLRLLDRARVNDAVKAVLAPLARGADLDNIAASANVARLIVTPANPQTGTAAVAESDESLLLRYLLAFDRPSAGSSGRYLYEAHTAWPRDDVDFAVIGRAVHGRRGDTDIVVSGPAGRDATDAELATVRTAVLSPNVVPEAVSVAVMRARRTTYSASLVLEILPGPDSAVIRADALRRVAEGTLGRTIIGGEVPEGFIKGLGYGPNILKVRDLSAVAIAPHPYTVPVCTGIEIAVEVRA